MRIERCQLTGLASEKGTILGIFRSLQALARAIGPLVASFGNDSRGFNRSFIVDLCHVAYWSIGEKPAYIIGALLLMLPLAILFDVQRRVKAMRILPKITVSEAKEE
jgi:MFS family permease